MTPMGAVVKPLMRCRADFPFPRLWITIYDLGPQGALHCLPQLADARQDLGVGIVFQRKGAQQVRHHVALKNAGLMRAHGIDTSRREPHSEKGCPLSTADIDHLPHDRDCRTNQGRHDKPAYVRYDRLSA